MFRCATLVGTTASHFVSEKDTKSAFSMYFSRTPYFHLLFRSHTLMLINLILHKGSVGSANTYLTCYGTVSTHSFCENRWLVVNILFYWSVYRVIKVWEPATCTTSWNGGSFPLFMSLAAFIINVYNKFVQTMNDDVCTCGGRVTKNKGRITAFVSQNRIQTPLTW